LPNLTDAFWLGIDSKKETHCTFTRIGIYIYVQKQSSKNGEMHPPAKASLPLYEEHVPAVML
jgi:hypothetical protein